MHDNNHDYLYLLRELRAHGLSDEVRARMRAHLSAYADFHAVQPGALRPTVAAAGGFAWLTGRRWTVPSAALLLFALLAGGTTYASESALPGQPLYTVKVRVAEPLELALANSAEEKGELHSKLAERRLEEAAKLAVNQSLDGATAVFLEQKFSQHVDGTLAAADAVQAEGKADASLTLRSDLEARLVAHADILDLVEDHLENEGATVARASTQSVLDTVKLRQEVVSETRIALERDLEKTATPTETLALVTKASVSVSPATQASLMSPVMEHVADADVALTAAKESLEGDGPQDQRRAFRKAHEAQRNSDVVSILLENQDILMAVTEPTTGTTTPETVSSTTPTTTPGTPTSTAP